MASNRLSAVGRRACHPAISPSCHPVPKGQILVIAILILSVLTIIVPLLIMYSEREAKWSTMQKRNTTAFHLAEAATERGYLIVTLSTANYWSIQNGTPLTGYNYDTAYSDVAGGTYAIRITSGANTGEVIITGIGKESQGNSVRTIQITYADAPFGNVAIWANGGVAVTGNNFTVEWGAIMTPKSITIAGRTYPQLWSAGTIDTDSNGATPPNCDQPNCCFWHSFNTSIPPTPTIDFSFYKSSAQASGTYYSGNQTLTISNTTGKTWYVDGNLSMGVNNYLKGNLIVIGDLNPPSGNWGSGSGSPKMPTKAWKQYCNSWATYQAYDTAEPASFPGLTSSYFSDANLAPVALTKICVWGFMYVGGNLNWGGGGGNADFVGVVYVNGQGNLGANSHANIWYNGDVSANVVTTNIVLTRQLWKETKMSWPAGL